MYKNRRPIVKCRRNAFLVKNVFNITQQCLIIPVPITQIEIDFPILGVCFIIVIIIFFSRSNSPLILLTGNEVNPHFRIYFQSRAREHTIYMAHPDIVISLPIASLGYAVEGERPRVHIMCIRGIVTPEYCPAILSESNEDFALASY